MTKLNFAYVLHSQQVEDLIESDDHIMLAVNIIRCKDKYQPLL